jgi:hypothetical protein
MNAPVANAAVFANAAAAARYCIYAFPHLPEWVKLPDGWRPVTDMHGADVAVAFERAETLARSIAPQALGLVPLLALSDDAPPWFDFRGESALSLGLTKAASILERLKDIRLPSSASADDLLLARLYSRQTDMTAQYDPSVPHMVAYPAADPLSGAVESANRLVEQGLMSRSFFDRLLTCRQCRSARLLAREECDACRSTNISEQALVHHFRCGHEGPQSTFKRGSNGFDCPKCNRELRHIGLDYDKPGTAVVCSECANISDNAAVGFRCADCGHHQDSESVPHRDWHHYRLTRAAVQSLRAGFCRSSTSTMYDPLRVLVEHAGQEKEEFGKAFQLMEVGFGAAAEIRRRSPRSWEQSYGLAVEAVRSAVRRIDRVGERPDGLMVLLQGLTAAEARKAIAGIRMRIADVVAENVDPKFTLLDDAAIQRWLHGEIPG